MRNLLEHKDNINAYVDSLYESDIQGNNLNELFGQLKSEELITCMYADNRAYNIQLTMKGKSMKSSDLKLTDKDELLGLIDKIDDIEKLFYIDADVNNRKTNERIYDVPEFQDWVHQVCFYLQKIPDRNNNYILETINIGNCWDGTDDRDRFKEFVTRLKSIERQIELYFSDDEKQLQKSSATSNYIKQYDVFISHANSDKLEYVEELYNAISKLGIRVFYDKETFEWGDNWKKKIIDGVNSSEFAIIVISNNYFGREWTEKELEAFLNRQNSSGEKIILPLLHGISVSDLCEYYPELGDIQAISDEEYDVKDVAILFAKQLLKRYRNN